MEQDIVCSTLYSKTQYGANRVVTFFALAIYLRDILSQYHGNI